MKKLVINIRAELAIPDDWTIEDHAGVVQVLRAGDKTAFFDMIPLIAKSDDGAADSFETDDDFVSEILEKVESSTTDLSLTPLL